MHIINERNTSRIVSLIDPRKVVVGGGYSIGNRFIEPTVMKDVMWDDRGYTGGDSRPRIARDALQ